MANATWEVKCKNRVNSYSGSADDSEQTARTIYADLAKRRVSVTLTKDGEVIETTVKTKPAFGIREQRDIAARLGLR